MSSLHPMALLLKNDGYPPAVIAAILIHGFLLFIIFHNPVMRNELVNLDEPIYINATTGRAKPLSVYVEYKSWNYSDRVN